MPLSIEAAASALLSAGYEWDSEYYAYINPDLDDKINVLELKKMLQTEGAFVNKLLSINEKMEAQRATE